MSYVTFSLEVTKAWAACAILSASCDAYDDSVATAMFAISFGTKCEHNFQAILSALVIYSLFRRRSRPNRQERR